MENITDTKETLLTQYNEALKFFDHWYQPYEEIVGFYRLKIIEKFATGIRRIKKEYVSFEESAIFEIHKTYIKFILPCVSYKKKEASESVEDFIVATIKKQGSITRAELEIITGLKKSRVSEVLKNLTDKGVIEKIGKARGTRYILGD